MIIRHHLSTEQTRQFGDEFGVDWERSCSSVEQLSRELDIDLERGLYFAQADKVGKRSSSTAKSLSLNPKRLPVKAKVRR